MTFTGPDQIDVCPSKGSLYGRTQEILTTGLMHIVFDRCSLTTLSPTSFVMSYGHSHLSVSFLEARVTFRLSVESQTLSPI